MVLLVMDLFDAPLRRTMPSFHRYESSNPLSPLLAMLSLL